MANLLILGIVVFGSVAVGILYAAAKGQTLREFIENL